MNVPRPGWPAVGEVTLSNTDRGRPADDVRIVHTERREKPLPQQRSEVAAATLGKSIGQHHKREIRILELRTGRALPLRLGEGAEKVGFGQARVGVTQVGSAPRERWQARGVSDDIA